MDQILMWVIGIKVTFFLTLFGMVFRRMNDIDSRLRDAPDRDEVSKEIEMRQESVRVLIQEIKEDIKYLREKSDK